MSALIEAELLKLRTTRLLWAVAGATLAITLISIVISVLSSYLTNKTGQELADAQREMFNVGSLCGLLLFILGLSGVTSEFRFGTITPTLLAAPDRRQVILAKAAAYGLVALVLTAAASLLAAIAGFPLMVSRDITIEMSTADYVATTLGGLGSALLMCLLGLGLGTAVRSTVAVLVGFLALVVAGMPLLSLIWEDSGQYLPLDLAAKAAGAIQDGPPQLASMLILAGYAAVALVAGIALLERRDVT